MAGRSDALRRLPVSGAMKMGPARLLEAATVAEGLRREGPREALDSLSIARARALAAFLWTKSCGPGGKA